MIFEITGADSKTAAERTVYITADDEREAVSQAKEHGLYPYRVVRSLQKEKEEEKRLQEEAHHVKDSHEERERQKQAELLEERIKFRVTDIKSLFRARLEIEKPVFFYDSIYVPVDSILLDEKMSFGFDLSEIRSLGVHGWEVVQVVPRTIGVGLKNTSAGSTFGESWGAGSGGNVTGVYLIIKKTICIDEITDAPDDEVALYIRSNFAVDA